MRERYESFHQVHYTDDALAAAVIQSSRYIPDRFLPDKAIDVIDEAGARVKLRVRAEQGSIDALTASLNRMGARHVRPRASAHRRRRSDRCWRGDARRR